MGDGVLQDRRSETAAKIKARPAEVSQRFEAAFWLEDLGTYALALDGAKRPCRVRASNAGHALFGGIASPERATHVARSLMAPQSFSGWGIRTLAEGERRFNPMSYHNGSVWPHDNGLIAMGLGRYGLKQQVADLLAALVDASRFTELRRLPEFICGFSRRVGSGPTLHPNACAPQAWAASSVIGMVGALLGISFDRARRRVTLSTPVLPASIEAIHISQLRLGDASIDFTLRRSGDTALLSDVRRNGDIDVTVSA